MWRHQASIRNKVEKTMKQSIINQFGAALICIAPIVSVNASSFESTEKEINILSNIVKASLQDNKALGLQHVQGRYLAGQGVVLTIKARGFRAHPSGFNFPTPELFEMEFEAAALANGEVDLAAIREIETAFEHVEMANERIASLADEERSLEFAMRDLERSLRDIELETRLASEQARAELNKRSSALQQNLKELESKKEQVRQARKESKEALKAKSKERVKAQTEQKAQLITQVSDVLSQTLCDYGAGIKSLSPNEYVNFVIERAGDERKDKIFIFQKKDVEQCVKGKLTAAKLLAKATSYNF